jgi:hypothetical protein
MRGTRIQNSFPFLLWSFTEFPVSLVRNSKCRARMAITNALASLAVKDLRVSEPWYEKLFGRPADSRPMGEVVEWKFEGGGWLQVYEGPERAGHGSCTLAVTSLEEQIAALRGLGIGTGEPSISPQVKVIMVKDPDGNSIAFAEATDPSMAR